MIRGLSTNRLLRLCLGAIVAIASIQANASDWIYRVRPGDNVWELAALYMKPSQSWQKLQAYNTIADPLHLTPGSIMRFPIEWLRVAPAKATVVAVVGHATAGSQQSPTAPVVAGMQLGYGTRIVTAADASLTLRFADGSQVLVTGGSELDLDRMSAYGSTGMVDTRLRLQHGRVSSRVTPLTGTAAHFSIATPGTISSVRGTHFRVAADAASQQAWTEVTKGRVAVAGKHRSELVPAGKGVETDRGAAPSPSQALLPPPTLSCPTGVVSHLPLNLRWPALPGAVRYRVQLSTSPKFEALLENRVLDLPQVGFSDLPDGDRALRVRGVAANGLEGEDAVCAFTVAAHPQPPLVMAPAPGSKVRDARPRFAWTQSEEAASYDWQLAGDPSFSHLLASQPALTGSDTRAPADLPLGRYYWRIATRDHQGKLGPFTDPLPFVRVQQLPAPAVGQPRHQHGQLDFAWQQGLPGQHYRVELSATSDFAHPLLDRVVDTAALSIHKPGHGVWYLRVRTIDTDGYAGPWGPVQRIKLPCVACRIVAAGGGAVVLWLLL